MFAGVPIVTSIMDFTLNSQCAWFAINDVPGDDEYCELSITGSVLSKPKHTSSVKGPLQDQEIIESILGLTRVMFWSEALEILRSIRRGLGARKLFIQVWWWLSSGLFDIN